MIRILSILLFLLLSLESRENPFFPAKDEKEILTTSNKSESAEPLQRSSITLPSSARKIRKVTIEYINLDASVETKSITLDNSIDWHLPIFISQNYSDSSESKGQTKAKKAKKSKYKKVASIKYASFFTAGKRLKIITKDKIIRNFMLVDPHRIVLDFKRDASLKSYIKANAKNRFCKIRVGNHNGYYRAVIELDGLYQYEMKKISNGYQFILK